MKKKSLIILVAAITVSTIAFVYAKQGKPTTEKNKELMWFTDVMKADSIAHKNNKVVFGFFTGSDWCGWCHKLQRNVFAKKEFKEWADKNVVLLELDFPRRKELPNELKLQNTQLAQAFQVQGYPTVWLFTLEKDTVNNRNIKLNALGSLGYPTGAIDGKEEITFIDNANEILAKTKKKKKME
jgi:thioredoxin-related protein